LTGEIPGGLRNVSDPERRDPRQRKFTLHFENVTICSTRMVMRQLEKSGFKRVEHWPYSPDLAPSNFFLSVPGKNN
jgi:hypothetical protein